MEGTDDASEEPPVRPRSEALGPGSDVEHDLRNQVMHRLFGAAHQPKKARVFGRYEAVGRLGAGAMGTVYLARDPELEREVAIKVLHAEIADSDRAQLVLEAKAMARLKHPNVVAVYDVGEQDGEVFVAMERIGGVTLREWQDASERTAREVVGAYLEAARGLHAAHLAGIVHRDFKPDNVLFGDDGRVTVMDFGLARVKESARERVAQSIGPASVASLSDEELRRGPVQNLSGTPAYMAPEYIRGGRGNAASDQFSFCVALYEALCGERPFVGVTLVTLLTKISTGEREARPAVARVPQRLWQVIERGLKNNPKLRYPSMAALIAALEQALVPRWRRHGGVLLVASLMASAGGGALAYRSLDRSTCIREGARVDEVWSAEAQASVRSGLLGTDLSYAPTTWERVDEHLDGWSSRWRQVRVEACEQRTRDGRAAQRVDCLDRQLGELSGLLEVLTVSDPAIAEQALGAVTQLPAPSRCQDDQWVMTTSVAGSAAITPAERRRVEAARERLSRARALDRAGKHEQALVLAREQLATAEALEHAPLQAEALLRIGAIQDSLGQYAEAEGRLLDAYVLATEVDAPRVALEAGVMLIRLVGARLDRTSEAYTWGRLTLGYVERLGENAGLLAADRLCGLVEVDLAGGDKRDAQQRARAARELALEILEEDDPRHTHFLSVEARVYQSLGEFEQSAALNRRSIALIERVLGPEHPSLVPHLTNLTIVQGTLNQLAEARETATRGLELQVSVLGPDHPAVGGALNNLGNIAMLQGDLRAAAELQERSLTIKTRSLGAEHAAVLRQLQNLGTLELQRGKPREALEYFTRALEGLQRTHGPTHPDLASALLNLASAHSDLGDEQRAVAVLDKARTVLESGQEPDSMTMGIVLYNLTNSQIALDQPEIAKDSVRRSLTIFEQRLGVEHPRVGAALAVYGGLLWSGGDHDEATRLLERSLEILTATDQTVLSPAHPRFTLAQLRWEQGQHQEALALATRALNEAAGAAVDAELLKQLRRWIDAHPPAKPR